jgi:hypothetical protein
MQRTEVRGGVLPPVVMLVPPTPIFALALGSEPGIFAILALTPFLHQPMAIGAIFGFVPFVPIMMLAVIIAMNFTKTRNRRQEYGS